MRTVVEFKFGRRWRFMWSYRWHACGTRISSRPSHCDGSDTNATGWLLGPLRIMRLPHYALTPNEWEQAMRHSTAGEAV